MGRLFGAGMDTEDCAHCGGQGWFGIDPHMPVQAGAGSVQKVAMLSVRYANGIPLWDQRDGVDGDVARRLAAHHQGQVSLSRRMAAFRAGEAEDADDSDLLPVTMSP